MKDDFMSQDEANKILNPIPKIMSYKEGFEIYKNFLGRPLECNTTINVDGYEPRMITGFVISSPTKPYDIDITDELLEKHYSSFLNGESGDYNF